MRNSLERFLLVLAAVLWLSGTLCAQSGSEFGGPAGPRGDYSTATEASGPGEPSGSGSASGMADPSLQSLEDEPAPGPAVVDALTSDEPLDDRQMDDRQTSDEPLDDRQMDDRQTPDEPLDDRQMDDRQTPDEPIPADDRLQDDRRQGDGEFTGDPELGGPPAPSTGSAAPSRKPARRTDTVRYRVVPRLLPVEGLPGSLYRWSVVDAVPVTGSPDLVEVVDLLCGHVSWANVTNGAGDSVGAQALHDAATAGSAGASEAVSMFDPFRPTAEDPVAGAGRDDLTTGSASAAQPDGPAGAAFSGSVRVSGDPVLLYTAARGKVRGKLKLSAPAELDLAGTPFVSTYLGTLHPVTPRGMRLPVDGLERIGEGEVEPADLRFESGDVTIRFARSAGSDAAPALSELSPDDPSLATLHVIDYEGGLAEEMAHYAALKRGEALHVFVNDDGGVAGAYESRWLPVPGRSDLTYRSVDLQLMGGGATTLVEPCPVIVFSTSYVENQIPRAVLSTLKHELGHVLHELKAPTRHRGYGNSFWQHTYAVRSNDQAAFVEGFAEYTAFRFADDQYEANPTQSLQDLQWRHNNRAYEDLTFFYWCNFCTRSAVRSRLSSDELGALQLKLFDYQGKPERVRPSPEEFQARLVREATGKGQPAFTAAELNRELASLNASNPQGLKNWASERISPETQRLLDEAHLDLLRGLHPLLGQANATVAENLAVISRLSMRSPEDLMMNEGTVAALLLELDRELRAQGVDFYGKVLGVLDQDPYASAAGPAQFSTGPSEVSTQFRPPQRPVPTNFKELIALLDRDPELTGKLFPVIEKASQGVLTAKHFVLAPRRDLDPLTRMDPGDEAMASTGAGSARGGTAGEATGQGDPLPEGGSDEVGPPAVPDEFVGSDDRAIPDAAPEAQPDFDDLRGR